VHWSPSSSFAALVAAVCASSKSMLRGAIGSGVLCPGELNVTPR
jgi:hypothetical protein